MTDKELADKVVALGVGTKTSFGYQANGYHVAEPYFVRDWRVAGALMEKFTWNEFDNVIWDIFVPAKESRCDEPIDPRAITEACVEALSDE